MAIPACDFNRRPDFAIQFRIAVHVIPEVAVDTMHALFQMNVQLMHGRPTVCLFEFFLGPGNLCANRRVVPVAIPIQVRDMFGFLDAPHPILGRGFGNRIAEVVQWNAFAILLEHRGEYPTVSVEVGELCVSHLRIETGNIGQEVRIRPLAANRRAFGI